MAGLLLLVEEVQGGRERGTARESERRKMEPHSLSLCDVRLLVVGCLLSCVDVECAQHAAAL